MTAQASKKPPSPQHWWTPGLDRPTLQRLVARRDMPGLLFFGAWVAGLCLTTVLLAAVWGSFWVAPALLLHGAVLSFAYAASHEGAHGTAFKSTWLNETVFYVTSFVFGEEPMFRRYSHGRHHAYTWYPDFDSQMPYRNPMTLRSYIRETLALAGMRDGLKQMARHAAGRIREEEKAYIPASKVNQLVWGARLFLAGYVGIIAAAVLMQSGFIAVAFFGGRIVGGWVVQLFINSQHMCMDEAVADHRYSTRSLKCGPITRLLYWNMNFHIEHHLYPGVPFHALPETNRLVAGHLPLPVGSAVRANLEILGVIRRQASDPACVSRPSFSG